MVLPLHVAAERVDDLLRHLLFARGVHAHGGFDQFDRRAGVARGFHQRQRVLRKARAAIAGAGVQEFAADAVVEADAARDFLHIGAELLRRDRRSR